MCQEMLDDKVCGTWWYCVNANGSRWLIDGDKPRASGGYYMGSGNVKYGWISLDNERYGYYKGVKISREEPGYLHCQVRGLPAICRLPCQCGR